MNYKLVLSYDGGRYDGWQKQGNTPNTIQGRLEGILSRLAGTPVEVHGAGRTDAGVHALGQTASFRLPGERPPEEVAAFLCRELPDDMAVVSLRTAGDRFHARLNAVGKTYLYAIRLGPVSDPFRRRYQLRVPEPLDLEAMERAAALLTGRHDYRSFCSNKKMKKSTIRTVDRIELCREGADLTIAYHGDGFLYHMVRILTGTLIEVGRGARRPEEMPQILAARDRAAAGSTAPPQGLALAEVEY